MVGFLPGTYGTSLLRQHALQGVFDEMLADGLPEAAVNGMKDAVDCNVYLFGAAVEPYVMYLVLCGASLLLLGIYILLNAYRTKDR